MRERGETCENYVKYFTNTGFTLEIIQYNTPATHSCPGGAGWGVGNGQCPPRVIPSFANPGSKLKNKKN